MRTSAAQQRPGRLMKKEKRALWRLKYAERVTSRDPPMAFSRVL